jgi:2',3'-cyclic-nucleotide 2'-phosphodiesterase (5'-nucleotidase family)
MIHHDMIKPNSIHRSRATNLLVKKMNSGILLMLFLGMVCILPQSAKGQNETTSGEKSLLILHTNDIHDHLRPDYSGTGGLPFVSGYIRKVRSERSDVLVLDAGDVAEKGELVARKTNSEFTFEMMKRVGYNAWTPGNHDYDFGMEALHRFTLLAGMDIVCINLFREDGRLEFPASVIYKINELSIGVIGAIDPRDRLSLNLEETAIAIRDEAAKLSAETDLIIGLMHITNRDASYIAKIASDLDIIIAGHSHQETHQPIVVPETGVIILQAGDYARMVGSLDLRMNAETGKIQSYEYELIEMDHLSIAPDLEMIELVRRKELELAPESQQIVSWSPRRVSYTEVGLLAAEALRVSTGADVAFHKTRHIVRADLPAGILDLNAFYRTGGERGHHLIMVELTGSEIADYIQALPMNRWLPTQWSGFRGHFNGDRFETDLDPARMYRVVMPLREWEQRFTRIVDRVKSDPESWPGISPVERNLEITGVEETWTEAVGMLLESYRQSGSDLLESIKIIAIDTGQESLPGLQMN